MKHVNSSILAADRAAVAALKDLSGYQPHNSTYSLDAVLQSVTVVDALREEEARLTRRLASVRDARQAAEVHMHTIVSGAKVEVKAQYGANSDEIQALGLKKQQDYKRTARRSSNGVNGANGQH